VSAPSVAAQLTQKSGSNFYYAFRLLPARKRRAIYALYSFCRVVDDCVDEPDGGGEAALMRWHDELLRCYAGRPETALGRELAAAVKEFPIPRVCLEDILAGCRMDATPRRYGTYDDLTVYCRRVASAVGLASIEIFGYTQPATREYAIELGLALQLTNILRDVASDAARGRLYLPLEDVRRFGLDERDLLAHVLEGAPRPPQVTDLLAFEGHRARAHFERAAAVLPRADRRSLLPAEVMAAVYRELFELLARRGWPLAAEPLRLRRSRKLWIALRTAVGVYTA